MGGVSGPHPERIISTIVTVEPGNMLAAVRLALPLSNAAMTIWTVPPVLVRIVTR
jgi:hypothetical protein